MVIIGGESQGDSNDVLMLDLETDHWVTPSITNQEAFTPRRFHTSTAIGSNIYVFGGCVADY